MKAIIFLFMLVVLAGCSTPYKPEGISGGFTETRYADNSYLVRFQGNGYTSQTASEEMALLRAAELTLEKGFKYFGITVTTNWTSSSTYVMPSQTRVTGSIDQWGNVSGRATTTGGNSVDFEKSRISLYLYLSNDNNVPTIQMLDAASIVSDLGKKYKK